MAKPKPEPILADTSLEQSLKTAPTLKKMMEDHQEHGHTEQSVREDDYRGHHIVIQTTYAIKVDGKPFHAALGVSNAGNVQYHGIPNVGFASAVDLMHAVIDQFPEEFPKVKKGAKKPPLPPPIGGHEHSMHDHAAMTAGTKKSAKPRVKKAGR